MLPQEEFVEIHATRANGAGRSQGCPPSGPRPQDGKGPPARKTPNRPAPPGRRGPLREVRALRGPAPCRRSPSVGDRALRRSKEAWLPAELPDVHAPGAIGQAAPALPRLQGREGSADRLRPEHPPGEEIQWDWLELPDTPWGRKACVLAGTLSHSGRFRAHLSERMDHAHLVRGIHAVLERLGGSARRWRVDRMATAIVPGTDRIQPSFAAVARHYSVAVDPCPARRPNRKGASRELDQIPDRTLVAHRPGQ